MVQLDPFIQRGSLNPRLHRNQIVGALSMHQQPFTVNYSMKTNNARDSVTAYLISQLYNLVIISNALTIISFRLGHDTIKPPKDSLQEIRYTVIMA